MSVCLLQRSLAIRQPAAVPPPGCLQYGSQPVFRPQTAPVVHVTAEQILPATVNNMDGDEADATTTPVAEAYTIS